MRKLFIAAAFSLLSVAAQADDLKWFPGNNVGGASILYGEPDTDNIWFNANCIKATRVVQVLLGLDTASHATRVGPHSKSYTLTVKIGGESFRLIGTVEPEEMDDSHSFITMLTPDHPFLQKLARESKAEFHYGKFAVKLNSVSASGVARVIKNCG